MKTLALLALFSFLVIVPSFPQNIKYINESEVADTVAKGAQLYKINDSVSYVYTPRTPFKYILYAGQDLYQVPVSLFKKESIVPALGIAGSTALLIAFDEQITDGVQRFSRYIHLSDVNNAQNISPVDGVPLYVPTDLSTGLYYIGDGTTELLINGGFYVYGLIHKDNRALRTASQLSEGIISVGIWVQLLKHITGRTTAQVNENKDMWRWFPNPLTYSKHVPHYDAFPSGHLSIAMATVTIIAENYPEYKFIKPLGYSLMGLCGFQMINNGVHWAGDYPLAIAMGYTFGKFIVNRDRLKVKKQELSFLRKPETPSFQMHPAYLGNGAMGMRLTLSF